MPSEQSSTAAARGALQGYSWNRVRQLVLELMLLVEVCKVLSHGTVHHRGRSPEEWAVTTAPEEPDVPLASPFQEGPLDPPCWCLRGHQRGEDEEEAEGVEEATLSCS